MSNFRVGQKVVCVDDRANVSPPPIGYTWSGMINISKGEIYTIESIVTHPYTGCVCATFIEVPRRSMMDFGYSVKRFRPLITPKQDIALFHALCPGLHVVPPAVVPNRVPVPSPSD